MPATLTVFPRLRLLHNSLPTIHFSTMKSNPPLNCSRGFSSFCRLFPHKLKYQSFRFPILPIQQQSISTTRRFSTRAAASGSKSLMDDEADLSDWVSGLSSQKKQVFSDSDDENRGGSRGGSFGRDRGSGGKFTGRDDRTGGSRTGGFSKDRGSGNRFTGREERSGGSRNGGFRKDPREERSRIPGVPRPEAKGNFRGREEGGSKRRREDGLNDFGESRRRSVGEVDSFAKRNGKFDEKRTITRGSDRSNGTNSFSRQRGADSSERFSKSPNSSDIFSKRFKDGHKTDRKIEQTRSSDMGHGRNSRGKGVQPGKFMVSDLEDEDEDEDDEDDEDDEEVKGFKSFKDLINTEDDSEEVDEDDSEEVDEDDIEDVDEDDSEDEDDDDDDDEVVDGVLSEKEAVVTETRSKKASPSSPSETSDSYLTNTRFEDCSISPLSLKALKAAGYEKMTVVQEATLPTILKGKDVLAKARTGTGKTVAFLLPSIEVVVKSPPVMRDDRRPPILVLIICPTRELASQAANEANTLIKYHPSLGVQVVIGGTRLTLEQKRMQANPCQILVATPGRLKDHIENTAGFATRLMGVKVLVLDEADHLLDMGFRRDIETIVAAVPKQRQTLLFSATVPNEVRSICHVALKRDHEYINTVKEGSEETHAQVRQTHIIAPLEKQFSLLYAMLKEHIADDVDYKVLVFCTTAMVTRLVADLLGELHLNVREIHSRKPQSYRTRVSEEFRKSKGLILVTSDVSARGVDYPDVSLVIQIGLPADRQQYVHRLGRTGRKGKEGLGILMLSPWEEFFLSTVKDLPISKADLPLVDPETKKKVERALSNVEMKNKEAAYQAWLGYYNSNKTVSRDKTKLVELANEFSRSMGLDNPPAIPKLVLGKMGLKNVPGLRSK